MRCATMPPCDRLHAVAVLACAVCVALPGCDIPRAGVLAGHAATTTPSATPHPAARPPAEVPDDRPEPALPCADTAIVPLRGEDVRPTALTATADGHVVVVGRFSGALSIGGLSLDRGAVDATRRQGFAAMVDAETCTARWLIDLGRDLSPVDVGTRRPVADWSIGVVGPDPSAPPTPTEALAVAATFQPPGEPYVGLVLRLATHTGAEIARHEIAAGPSDGITSPKVWLRAVAVASDGALYLGGDFSGTLAVGSTSVATREYEPNRGFVIRLPPADVSAAEDGAVADPDGAWVLEAESCHDTHVTDLVALPNGGVAVAGRFFTWVCFGPCAHRVMSRHAFDDQFVTVLDRWGGMQPGVALGVLAAEGPQLAVDESGTLYAASLFYASDDLPLPGDSHPGGALDRQLLARLDVDSGAKLTWLASVDAALVRHMGGPAPRVAVSGGQLLMAGLVLEETTFAVPDQRIGGSFPELQGFMARYDLGSPILWGVEAVGGGGEQGISDLVGDHAARFWVVGQHTGTVTIGDATLSTGGPGGYLARHGVGPGW